ncbi:class I SAM-dependent rRNA methyltransferase [Streptococcus sp. S784/96/1]|uniref:class I SAM-dependent rRNA methyltransferase n=1 Tax=Streptococcus sp. S784/96/1 TaxID=2653499 RepID=UPI001389722A|nr:class I SAM-dependent rRNA methyltransferase [Streptococcus sp. S784/96/1]
MIKLVMGDLAEKRVKSGVQLIDGRDFLDQIVTDGVVSLVNQKGAFLGTAYLSRQNKGIGWVLSREAIEVTEDYLIHLFKKAKQKRRQFEMSDLTTAYRLFNQDGDNLGGLTIDRYGDYALFSWYNSYIYRQKELIISAFQKVFPELKGAYGKVRFKSDLPESSYLYGEEALNPFEILENGVRYSVFLNDGLMTGIFLDQHEVRGSLVDGLALGKTVLNMFSYTAAFSVAAAMGGAIETTSVDLAKRSRELSQAHFDANGLDTEHHRFVVMDVFDYFKYAKRHSLRFDVIVIDPPSFARNKKQTFSVLKDYHKLIAQALDILSPRGIIVASTNASNMTTQQFKKQIQKGLGKIKYQFIDLKQLPGDFTVNKNDESSNYLKVFTIKVNQ